MHNTVLILGARGRFGWAAARAFADAGWRVLGQMRPGAKAPADERIHWLDIDPYHVETLAAAAQGAAVVVHGLNPRYTHAAWRAEAMPMLDAAIAVARALGATLMLPGNVYNFGTGMPALLRVDTPQHPDTVKGRIRVEMEQQLRLADVRGVVIRAGDFFGAGRGSWFDLALAKDLRRGICTYPGPPDVATAWAYLPDLARAFVAVAERRARLARFEVLHFAGYSVTGRQWAQALEPVARERKWIAPTEHLKLRRLPWAMIRLGAGLNPMWGALAEMRYLWTTPHGLANERLSALIGTEPHRPLAQAARAALADLGLIPARDVGPTTSPLPLP